MTCKRTSYRWRPRRQRKAAFISVKNDIRRHTKFLGGLFTTYDYLHGKNGWIDCLFLSKKPQIFYNCVIDTTTHMFKESVWELAYERSYALVPETNLSLFDQATKDPISGRWKFTPTAEKQFYAFGGLTRSEWVNENIRIIANKKIIQVNETVSLHHDYKFGIGLHATLDVPYLTIETVSTFIERFLLTETEYRISKPIIYCYDEIENWHIESNLIADFVTS